MLYVWKCNHGPEGESNEIVPPTGWTIEIL